MDRKALFLWFGLFIALGLFFQNCSKNLVVDVQSSGTSASLIAFETKPSCYFNGNPIAEGQFVTAYLNSTPEFTTECRSEPRVCKGGALSGTFTYASCKNGPKACLFNGITINSGSSVKAFAAQNSNQCASELRSCNDGQLSGSFPFSECQQNLCLFNGRTLTAGQAFTYYTSSSGSCQVRTGYCQLGGYLVDSQKAPLTSSVYETCSASATCTLQGETLSPNQTFYYYAASNSCQGQPGYCDSQGTLRDSATQNVLSGVFGESGTCSIAVATASGSTGSTSGGTSGDTSGNTGGSVSPTQDYGLSTCQLNGRTLNFGEQFQYYYYPTGDWLMCQPSTGICAPNGELKRMPYYQPLPQVQLYDSCVIPPPPKEDIPIGG